MLSLFSCFRGTQSHQCRTATSETAVASREVQITPSTKETGGDSSHGFHKDVKYDEKVARESLSEDGDMENIDITEKHHATQIYSNNNTNQHVLKQRLTRRSIGWRSKKKTGKDTMAPIHTHNTGDELHRWAEFDRKVKKLNPTEAERAWAIERARRQKWSNDKQNAKRQ
ncbi:hypothetical protein P154DRAFT_574431 [Amniculicola lignicola CBS 123094]|uniref:Uncharacterized protein n=1 Tax=Amniculicola lignicola CBS 123094 TaxID=1392246 RepID=A0A6A5WM86_9PLEO|nr:hypothetical protein P154DRAFT_574431 [Amniculicola lignicola CBS 123094]